MCSGVHIFETVMIVLCVLIQLAPTRTESLVTAMKYVKNPRKACESLYLKVKELNAEIRQKMASQPHCKEGVHVCIQHTVYTYK